SPSSRRIPFETEPDRLLDSSPDRSTSPHQLFAKHVGSATARQRVDDTKNGDGKGFGSSHQLGARHDLSLTSRNPQSTIRIRASVPSHPPIAHARSAAAPHPGLRRSPPTPPPPPPASPRCSAPPAGGSAAGRRRRARRSLPRCTARGA